MNKCELCDTDGGELLWRNESLRVVRVSGDEGDMYPGFCRVIWNQHVKEVSDLAPAQQAELMKAVFTLEQALRIALKPEKMNLASLGNMTPHVHWHVIPRFVDDPAYPKPIWAITAVDESVMPAVVSTAWTSAIQDALNRM